MCDRCGCPDLIRGDGPPCCKECLRAAVTAASHPELLRESVIRLLERDHGDVVLLGFDRGPRGSLVKAWRWVGP